MIGRTLGFYLAARFTRAILAVFGTIFILVYLIDLYQPDPSPRIGGGTRCWRFCLAISSAAGRHCFVDRSVFRRRL